MAFLDCIQRKGEMSTCRDMIPYDQASDVSTETSDSSIIWVGSDGSTESIHSRHSEEFQPRDRSRGVNDRTYYKIGDRDLDFLDSGITRRSYSVGSATSSLSSPCSFPDLPSSSTRRRSKKSPLAFPSCSRPSLPSSTPYTSRRRSSLKPSYNDELVAVYLAYLLNVRDLPPSLVSRFLASRPDIAGIGDVARHIKVMDAPSFDFYRSRLLAKHEKVVWRVDYTATMLMNHECGRLAAIRKSTHLMELLEYIDGEWETWSRWEFGRSRGRGRGRSRSRCGMLRWPHKG